MTLKECYAKLCGDYEDALSRLQSERLVQKFVLKFLNDKSYELLCKSMEEKNYEEAFRAVHTIKGVSQNLSFTKLIESSEKLTQVLRGGNWNGDEVLYNQVLEDYKSTAAAIEEFKASVEG